MAGAYLICGVLCFLFGAWWAGIVFAVLLWTEV